MELKDIEIDRVSFQLGITNCFAEMVACGVKKLALSPPISGDECDAIKKIEAKRAKTESPFMLLEG